MKKRTAITMIIATTIIRRYCKAVWPFFVGVIWVMQIVKIEKYKNPAKANQVKISDVVP